MMNQSKPAPSDIQPADAPTRIDPFRDQPVRLHGSAVVDVVARQVSRPRSACPICDDAGWVKEAVPFGHPHFGRLFPCECKQQEQARQRAAELMRISNLDALRDKTFALLNPFIPGLREVLPRIQSYARRPQGWLTLLGPCGIGKTHLAAAIGHEALQRNEQALFVVVPDLLDHLRSTFDPQSAVSYDERFELVRTVPLLILDDLGTESATSWAREKLYQLINHRYNYRLATVVTTNLKPEAIEPRIYSRLCDPACGVVITIIAQDYRQRQS
jgi:DNA replication protein DnaC